MLAWKPQITSSKCIPVECDASQNKKYLFVLFDTFDAWILGQSNSPTVNVLAKQCMGECPTIMYFTQ